MIRRTNSLSSSNVTISSISVHRHQCALDLLSALDELPAGVTVCLWKTPSGRWRLEQESDEMRMLLDCERLEDLFRHIGRL